MASTYMYMAERGSLTLTQLHPQARLFFQRSRLDVGRPLTWVKATPEACPTLVPATGTEDGRHHGRHRGHRRPARRRSRLIARTSSRCYGLRPLRRLGRCRSASTLLTFCRRSQSAQMPGRLGPTVLAPSPVAAHAWAGPATPSLHFPVSSSVETQPALGTPTPPSLLPRPYRSRRIPARPSVTPQAPPSSAVRFCREYKCPSWI